MRAGAGSGTGRSGAERSGGDRDGRPGGSGGRAGSEEGAEAGGAERRRQPRPHALRGGSAPGPGRSALLRADPRCPRPPGLRSARRGSRAPRPWGLRGPRCCRPCALGAPRCRGGRGAVGAVPPADTLRAAAARRVSCSPAPPAAAPAMPQTRFGCCFSHLAEGENDFRAFVAPLSRAAGVPRKHRTARRCPQCTESFGRVVYSPGSSGVTLQQGCAPWDAFLGWGAGSCSLLLTLSFSTVVRRAEQSCFPAGEPRS